MTMHQPAGVDSPLVLTVSELNAQIKDVLESCYPLVWVMGEISNFKMAASGHWYFTLKDDRSQIRAVFFQGSKRSRGFTPEGGLQVLCQSRLGIYEPRGEYQLIVEMMEPRGVGALQLAYEQLKKKLEGEGLFDASRKRPLPACPTHIAIVTSPTGAAIQDVLRVFERSPYPLTVTLLPVRVQGQEAAGEIAAAVQRANKLASHFQWDILIVGRGGGSIEDLWPFNEEIVARAMAASEIPTLSAVGHEIDFTISDLTADRRMPTPTAAAEWVVNQLSGFERDLRGVKDRMAQRLRQSIDSRRQRLEHIQSRLVDPRKRLADLRLFVDDRVERMQRAMSARMELQRMYLLHQRERLHRVHPYRALENCRRLLEQKVRELMVCHRKVVNDCRLKLQESTVKLDAMSPLSVLARGYSITYRLPENAVLRDSGHAAEGDEVLVRLARGRLRCVVEKIED